MVNLVVRARDAVGLFGGGGGALVAPASGRTYESRMFFDMNYTNNAAAQAAGLAIDTLGSGTPSWITDPVSGTNKVFQCAYFANEDSCFATATIATPSQSVYAQWSERWDPLWQSNDTGKANRFRSPEPSNVIIDHIWYRGAGDPIQGIVFQGSDVDWFSDSPPISPAIPKGEWIDVAMEEYLHPTDGYIKLYEKRQGGSWVMQPLKYNPYPHNAGGYAQFPYFAGQTAQTISRRLNRIGFGGWLSLGRAPGANARRQFKDCLVLSTVNGLPS